MSEAKLLEARDLIIKGDYEAARILLQPIDHPEARKLLEMLASHEKSTRFTAMESNRGLPKPQTPSGEQQSRLEAMKRRLLREELFEDELKNDKQGDTPNRFTALESDDFGAAYGDESEDQ
jgi:hypothetical protein